MAVKSALDVVFRRIPSAAAANAHKAFSHWLSHSLTLTASKKEAG
jgi:hypothetical protein